MLVAEDKLNARGMNKQERETRRDERVRIFQSKLCSTVLVTLMKCYTSSSRKS
jgi:hypothetical protein